MSYISKTSTPSPTLSRLVLLLVVLLASAGLIACGNEPDSPDSSEESADLQQTPDEPGDPGMVEDPPSVGTVSLSEAEDGAEEEVAALEEELDLRERELALKEKELELKERELAQQRRENRPPPPRTETPVVASPEPAPEPSEPAAAEPEPAPEPEPVEAWVDVPAGREMEVEFLTHVASNTSRQGDPFRTRILDPIYAGSGELAIPAGSEVVGHVVEARTNDQRIGGRSRLVLEFTDLVLPSGATIPVQASFAEESKSSKKKDAATIGGAAVAGAILGKVLGGDDKEVILGAILGGAAGTAIASRNKGENVEIPEGFTVGLVLDEAVAVRVFR